MNARVRGLCRRIARLFVGFGLSGLLLTSLVPSAKAQSSRGSIEGTVLDSGTSKYLEGAEIALLGTSYAAVTERDGSFSMVNVPTGTYTLVVNYPGIDTLKVPVTVEEGRATTVPIKVTSEVVSLETYKVSSTKEGMSQAIALQKIAINTKIIAASDQFGDIAEGNAAEYLKFLPGVGIDYNANDARAVSLRGMNTMFTDVLMDNHPLASASSGNLNRRFEFEQVAINNVETVEVYKTLTPDLPGVSTGGVVNMVTKSALDHEGNLLTYRVYLQADNSDLYLHKSEGWGQEQTHKILPGVDLNYGFRPTANIGLDFSYKNSQLFNDYPRSQYTWEYNPANGGRPDAPALTSWNNQNEQKDTRRQSFSGRLDYKLGPKTKLAVVGQWAFYDLLFTDRTITVNTGNLTPLATGQTSPNYGDGFVQGLPGKGSFTLATINRWKSGVTWDGSINLDHDFGNGGKFSVSPYWSQAYSKYRDITGSWYADAAMQRTGLTVRFENVGKVAPSYTILDSAGAPVDMKDVSKMVPSQMRSRPQTGVDTRDGITADFKTPNLPLRFPLSLTTGVALDYTTRNIENHVFNRTSFPGVTGADLVPLVDTGFINHGVGYGLPSYPFLSPYAAYTKFGGLSYLPWTPASDTVAWFDDTTNAGYVRIDATPLPKVVVAGGVRYESRETKVENRLPTLTSIVKSKFKDDRWFPSMNVKYSLLQNLVFRASYAKSIGLPDYSVLLPGPPAITQPDSSTGTRGRVNVYNPTLQPYKVDNYDVGAEYYFSRSAVVQVSLFQKDFTNYIVQAVQALTPELVTSLQIDPRGLNSPVDQYDVTYNYNVPEKGRYKGIEVAYSQNLTFLPKPFQTLGVQINGTLMSIDPIRTNTVFSRTDTNLNKAVLHQVQKSMEVAAVKQALNVQINWSIGKWGFNAVSNYTGHVLKSGSGTGQVSGSGAIVQKTIKYTNVATNDYYNELQYQAPRNVIDVRVDYKLNQHFTPYFEVRNILKRPIIIDTPVLPFNHAEYGDPIYELGLRGSW